ncbi:hypothetical protein HYV43_01860 [Candidatus Micrarchaeota archaeon]|nr:hypothetical protein [Candidatus Micrarchaeota archaeon]
MALSDDACQDLAALIVTLADFLPPHMRSLIRISESGVAAGIMEKREHFEQKVLEPLHAWMHQNNVAALDMSALDPAKVNQELKNAKRQVQDAFSGKR